MKSDSVLFDSTAPVGWLLGAQQHAIREINSTVVFLEEDEVELKEQGLVLTEFRGSDFPFVIVKLSH